MPTLLYKPKRTKLSLEFKKAFRRGESPWERRTVPEKMRRRFIPELKLRGILSFEHGVYGTVRNFHTRGNLQHHLHLLNRTNHLAKKHAFQFFDFHPTHVLAVDREKFRIAEQVYLAPNCEQITTYPESLLTTTTGKLFLRRMREKGLNIAKVRLSLEKALKEFRKWVKKNINAESKVLDYREQNILVLDYNAQTGKPLLAFIDHSYYSKRE